MIQIIIITAVLLALAVAGFAIKMFFFKNAEFKKTCGSVDPSGKPVPCTCGTNTEETCDNKGR